MAKKKHKHEEHENHERWLLTYADMITLLTAFFIMMYSMSVVNMQKFQQVAISIKSGFGGDMKGAGRSILSAAAGKGDKPSILPAIMTFPGHSVNTQMKKYIHSKKLDHALHLQETERGLVVSMMADKMVYAKGSADITPDTKAVLAKLGSLTRNYPNLIRVEGHTDDLPIHTAQYPSNWELSTARATSVVRYLVRDTGIDPARLSITGYANSRPKVPNDSEAHRAQNRRVDIVFLKGNGASPLDKSGNQVRSKELETSDDKEEPVKEAAKPDSGPRDKQG